MPALIMNDDGTWVPYEEFNAKEREREGTTEEEQAAILSYAKILVKLDEQTHPMPDPNSDYLDALDTDEDPQDAADRIFSSVRRDDYDINDDLPSDEDSTCPSS